MRAVAAVAVALAGSSLAVPALAEAGPSEPASPAASPPASPSAAPSPQAGISDAGLAEAVRRDLGMTLEEFNAAGAQAKRAADAASGLRGLPGYVGIRLKDGKIVVEGSGAKLQARIGELNSAGPAEFTLNAPAPEAPAPEATAPPVGAPTAPPAETQAAPDLVAGSTEQLFQAYVREVGPAGLQAVAYADGHFIIRTGGTNTPEAQDPEAPPAGSLNRAAEPAAGKISPADFVSRYANVLLEKGTAIKTEDDLFGGQGYVIDSMTICSAGFGAFDPSGLPLVLTAGHCAEDGTAVNADVEPPTAAPAGGSTTALPAELKPLGTFGFSQFGGPNNSPITGSEASPGNIGTDIAVLKGLRPGLNVQPSATTWENPGSPARTAVKIVGTAAPYQGQAVCRSGRTEGWSCGTVAETGIYVAAGNPTAGTTCADANGMPVTPCDLRAFKGFLSYDVTSSGGYSGGPWISGNYAVGTHSAGEPQGAPNFAVATSLEDALTHIPGGVQLQLFLNKPELTGNPGGAEAVAGEPITGTVRAEPYTALPTGTTVRITIAGPHALAGQSLEVPVGRSGTWQFPAPLPAGPLTFTATTLNGFSRSVPASFTVTVAPSTLAAPTLTTPTRGPAGSLTRIEGTGMPGAAVTLSGDVAGTGTVPLDGHWTVPLDHPAPYGKVDVSAVLSSAGAPDSPAAAATFTVRPPAPAVTGVTDGAQIRSDSRPRTIQGTGVDGAEVRVLIDGKPLAAKAGGGAAAGSGTVSLALPQLVVAEGRWSVPFPARLAPGRHTLSVTQSVDGVGSAPRQLAFTILAAPAAAPVEPGPPADPADPVPPADAAAPAGLAAAPAAPAGQAAAATPAAPAAATNADGPVVVTAGSGQLADTGAGTVLTTVGLAAGALLLGAVVLVGVHVAGARRRRIIR